MIEPTTTAWMYQGGRPAGTLEEIGKNFFDHLDVLERMQVEYDIGSEDIIGRRGTA